MVIRFFHPLDDLRLRKDFYTRSYPLHYFLILILEKEPVFPFSMLSAKQGNYWYHLHNVFGMTRSLTGDLTRYLPHSKPALYHKAIKEAVYVIMNGHLIVYSELQHSAVYYSKHVNYCTLTWRSCYRMVLQRFCLVHFHSQSATRMLIFQSNINETYFLKI